MALKTKDTIAVYSRSVSLLPDFHSMTMLNKGTVDVQVNSKTIAPNGQLVISGDYDTVNTTVYYIRFDPDAIGTRLLEVTRRDFI